MFPETGNDLFTNKHFVQLYHLFRRRQKGYLLSAFGLTVTLYLICSVAFEAVLLSTNGNLYRCTVFSVCLAFCTLILTLLAKAKWRSTMAKFSTASLWSIVTSSLLFDQLTMSVPTSDLVGWLVLMIFSCFLIMPLDLHWCVTYSFLLSLGNTVLSSALWALKGDKLTHNEEQVARAIDMGVTMSRFKIFFLVCVRALERASCLSGFEDGFHPWVIYLFLTWKKS